MSHQNSSMLGMHQEHTGPPLNFSLLQNAGLLPTAPISSVSPNPGNQQGPQNSGDSSYARVLTGVLTSSAPLHSGILPGANTSIVPLNSGISPEAPTSTVPLDSGILSRALTSTAPLSSGILPGAPTSTVPLDSGIQPGVLTSTVPSNSGILPGAPISTVPRPSVILPTAPTSTVPLESGILSGASATTVSLNPGILPGAPATTVSQNSGIQPGAPRSIVTPHSGILPRAPIFMATLNSGIWKGSPMTSVPLSSGILSGAPMFSVPMNSVIQTKFPSNSITSNALNAMGSSVSTIWPNLRMGSMQDPEKLLSNLPQQYLSSQLNMTNPNFVMNNEMQQMLAKMPIGSMQLNGQLLSQVHMMQLANMVPPANHLNCGSTILHNNHLVQNETTPTQSVPQRGLFGVRLSKNGKRMGRPPGSYKRNNPQKPCSGIRMENGRPRSPSEKIDVESTKEIVCEWENCFQVFTTAEARIDHVKAEHGERNCGAGYFCKWKDCSRVKDFSAHYLLECHVRKHTGEKPFKCTYDGCDHKYSRSENLKIHIRKHTGERPYMCQIEGCGKTFTNASDRSKHQTRTHLNKFDKPYMCHFAQCDKRYTDPSSLRKHIKTVHGEEAYEERKRMVAAERRQGGRKKKTEPEANLKTKDGRASSQQFLPASYEQLRLAYPQFTGHPLSINLNSSVMLSPVSLASGSRPSTATSAPMF